MLNLDVDASGATHGYILNRDGAIVATTALGAAEPPVSLDFVGSAFFRDAMQGRPGYQFAFDPASPTPDYFASYPIRDTAGGVIGVAVLRKSLDGFERDLRQFDRPYFLAGTAVPDWLSVADRGVRMRARRVAPLADSSGTIAAEVAAGVLQHLHDDHWSISTEDGSLSCHFEHTVAVTESGPRILTEANHVPVRQAV